MSGEASIVSRIYRYILESDFGMAPCPAGGLITLATCKPVIRRTASPGDWVIGFRQGSLARGLVLWAGKVAQILPHGEYERVHRGRPDAVYREKSDGSYARLEPAYHPGEQEKVRDLSGPVLVFDRITSRYLNGKAMPLPDDLMHLAAAGRGYRVNGVQPGDTARLERWVSHLKSEEPWAPMLPRNCGSETRASSQPRRPCGSCA